ncbi:MAG: hypothetical protein AABZ39_12240 [Spirochaetota bacterium]
MRGLVAAFCAAAFGISSLAAQSTSAFDVLTIGAGMSASSLANAAAAELDSIEGAFHNPATLGSLAVDLSAAGSYNPYLTMTLVSGIVAVRFKALTFAASAYGLLLDPIIGDIAYDGDVGRVLPAGDYVLGASGACSIDSLLSLPFMLSFGLTLRARAMSSRFDQFAIAA